ncbi:cysteine desulfurase [Carnobacteriaceae bacterium zg-ZUI78]|nr:cysteine desulfurase [Carnobacteriaceae bacterium zg-ZUI78]
MIYFDNSATTPMFKEVIDTMATVQENFIGNPSSLHHLGVKSDSLIDKARQQIADLLYCDKEEIFFTSGGTESNNTAIIGTAFEKQSFGKHIITTRIEHPSVLKTMHFLEKQGFDVTYLDVDTNGKIDVEMLGKVIRHDTILVSMMWVNNEVGILEPIQDVAILLEKYPTIHFHVDAVQALHYVLTQRIPSRVDLLSLSAHKFHGPRGIGILYKREGKRIESLLHGGGQEKGVRSGTENTASIAGMAKALRLYSQKQIPIQSYQSALRAFLSSYHGVEILSPLEQAPHILTFAIKGIRGEVLLHALEEQGIYLSTTSACSSKTAKEHHTLGAMNVSGDISRCAVRLSLSVENTQEEIARFQHVFDNVYQKFSKILKS